MKEVRVSGSLRVTEEESTFLALPASPLFGLMVTSDPLDGLMRMPYLDCPEMAAEQVLPPIDCHRAQRRGVTAEVR